MEKINGESSNLLGRVRVASPCPTSWDAMGGDERARFCRLCGLNVYNLSAMTRAEAEALVARTEGRLCARFYRRADGTILTRDCPTGLRAVRRRVRRTAAAVFAAIAGLWTAAAGQTPAPEGGGQGREAALSCKGGGQLKIKRKPVAAGEQPALRGVALDPNGVFIPGARVELQNEATKETHAAATDDEGIFSFTRFAPGSYTLRLEAAGFATQEVKKLSVGLDESLSVELVMSLGVETVTVGIVALEPWINSGGEIIYDGKLIRKLPIP